MKFPAIDIDLIEPSPLSPEPFDEHGLRELAQSFYQMELSRPYIESAAPVSALQRAQLRVHRELDSTGARV